MFFLTLGFAEEDRKEDERKEEKEQEEDTGELINQIDVNIEVQKNQDDGENNLEIEVCASSK